MQPLGNVRSNNDFVSGANLRLNTVKRFQAGSSCWSDSWVHVGKNTWVSTEVNKDRWVAPCCSQVSGPLGCYNPVLKLAALWVATKIMIQETQGHDLKFNLQVFASL